MRRQRFIYTLPSREESPVPFDSDDASISNPYSYPETIWSQIISPEPDAFIPYYIYSYPCLQIPVEQYPSMPGFYNPPMTPSLNSLEAVTHYNEEFNDLYAFDRFPNCNALYGDEFVPENYAPCEAVFPYENIEAVPEEVPNMYPMVTDYGAVTIMLRHLIRVDISPAKAVYVTNPPATCIAAMNSSGEKSCVIHPNGRVLHDRKEIHMSTLNRRAKISGRGVVFTSTDHCLSYLVDASGTKTTAEKFRDLSKDFSLEVFYDGSVARNDIPECYNMINKSAYKNYWNGDEVWCLGGFRIKQDQRGDVKVSRNGGRYVIRSSPTTGQISVKTASVEISVGRYPSNYFVVRKGHKQVTASLKGFNVQNGTQKAGFNSAGKVALF